MRRTIFILLGAVAAFAILTASYATTSELPTRTVELQVAPAAADSK